MPKAVFPASEHKYTAADGDFKYLGMVFPSEKSRNKGVHTWIGKANTVLHELYCCVVMKQGLSNKANFSVFKSLFRSSPVVMNLR